jgi:hypothetical protein
VRHVSARWNLVTEVSRIAPEAQADRAAFLPEASKVGARAVRLVGIRGKPSVGSWLLVACLTHVADGDSAPVAWCAAAGSRRYQSRFTLRECCKRHAPRRRCVSPFHRANWWQGTFLGD